MVVFHLPIYSTPKTDATQRDARWSNARLGIAWADPGRNSARCPVPFLGCWVKTWPEIKGWKGDLQLGHKVMKRSPSRITWTIVSSLFGDLFPIFLLDLSWGRFVSKNLGMVKHFGTANDQYCIVVARFCSTNFGVKPGSQSFGEPPKYYKAPPYCNEMPETFANQSNDCAWHAWNFKHSEIGPTIDTTNSPGMYA